MSSRFQFAGAFIVVVGIALAIALIPSRKPEEDVREHAPSTEADAAASEKEPSPMETMLSEEHSDRDRILALREIKRPFRASEIKQLMEVVRRKDAHPTLRNDIVARLTRDPLRPAKLGAELVAMWRDESEDPVWRDYALQHMESAYEFSNDRERIADALIEAGSSESASAGTALLALGRLAERHPDLKQTVEKLSVEAALSDSTSTDKLVTALQVAQDSPESAATVLARARVLAADKSAAARVRMSATATIGEIGGKEDVVLLERLTADTESRVQRTAAYNLERLKLRLQGGESGVAE